MNPSETVTLKVSCIVQVYVAHRSAYLVKFPRTICRHVLRGGQNCGFAAGVLDLKLLVETARSFQVMRTNLRVSVIAQH